MTDSPVAAEEARAAVERVIASGALGGAQRLPSLLRYVVDEYNEGRGDRLKAYTIATDVFQRGVDFDPQTDSIVRVEMGRLRKALEEYYIRDGSEDLVQIVIPRGTYQPEFYKTTVPSLSFFQGRKMPVQPWLFALAGFVSAGLIGLIALWSFWPLDQPDSLETKLAEPFTGLRVALQEFRAVDSSSEAQELALGLSSELVIDLSQYLWLSVYLVPNADAAVPHAGMPDEAARADFIVTGETQVADEEIFVRVRVMSVPSLKVEWSAEYTRDRTATEMVYAQHQIAKKIAEIVGQENGILPQLTLADPSRIEGVDYDAFRCMLGTYGFWRKLTPEAHAQQRDCLEETVKKSPDFADAWGALGHMYVAEGEYNFNPRANADPWADAKHAVDRALSLSATSGNGLAAAMAYQAAKPDPDLDAFRDIGMRYISLRPNNPNSLAEFGYRLGVSAGRWKESELLSEKAFSLTDQPPMWYYFAPAYDAILRDRDPQVIYDLARELDLPASISSHLIRAIAADKMGRDAELQTHLSALSTLGVETVENAVEYIKFRRFEPALEKSLIDGIRAAYDAEETASEK